MKNKFKIFKLLFIMTDGSIFFINSNFFKKIVFNNKDLKTNKNNFVFKKKLNCLEKFNFRTRFK